MNKAYKSILLLGGLLAVAFLGLIEYRISWELNLSVFYLVVVAVVSYHGDMTAGTVVALASAASWSLTEHLTGVPYTVPIAPYWNGCSRLALFLIIVYGLAFLKKEVRLKGELARTDPLTGVWNRRYFYELANIEWKRTARYQHPITVVYIDLDGFKAVNDTHGHRVGDEVLRNVASTIQANLRGTDFVARLGGDEFSVLLSETGQEAASRYLEKLRRQLLEAMKQNNWNVTFSIGAMTYTSLPGSLDEMIGQADRLMYAVKQAGKNRIQHDVFPNGRT